jgi:hypothetical protein
VAAMVDDPIAAKMPPTMIRPKRFARATDSGEEQGFAVFIILVFPSGLTKVLAFLLIITNSKIQASKKIFIHFNGLKLSFCFCL